MVMATQEKPLTQDSENTWVLLGLGGLALAAWYLAKQKGAAVCPPGYSLGSDGQCHLIVNPPPPGQCPSGTTGTPPNCVPIGQCPSGYELVNGACQPIQPPSTTPNVAISASPSQFTAKAGDYVTITWTITNRGTTPANIVADGLADQTMFVWNTAVGQHVLPPGNSGLQPMYQAVTIAPGASQTFSFRGQVSTDRTNFAFTVPLLATLPGTNGGPGVIIASSSVQITIPAAGGGGQCPVGYTGTPPNCVPATTCPAGCTGTPPNCNCPPPTQTTTLLGALQPPFTVPADGALHTLGLWVKNTGSVTARQVVFACAVSADQLASDFVWSPAPYYSIQGNIVAVLVGDLEPGQIWTGAFLFRPVAGATVGVVGKVTADNAPESDAGTSVTITGATPPPPGPIDLYVSTYNPINVSVGATVSTLVNVTNRGNTGVDNVSVRVGIDPANDQYALLGLVGGAGYTDGVGSPAFSLAPGETRTWNFVITGVASNPDVGLVAAAYVNNTIETYVGTQIIVG